MIQGTRPQGDLAEKQSRQVGKTVFITFYIRKICIFALVNVCTLGFLIRALPPIRALPRKNVKILIRALPPIRALPGKTESLPVTNVHRQNDNKNNKLLATIMHQLSPPNLALKFLIKYYDATNYKNITIKFACKMSHNVIFYLNCMKFTTSKQ